MLQWEVESLRLVEVGDGGRDGTNALNIAPSGAREFNGLSTDYVRTKLDNSNGRRASTLPSTGSCPKSLNSVPTPRAVVEQYPMGGFLPTSSLLCLCLNGSYNDTAMIFIMITSSDEDVKRNANNEWTCECPQSNRNNLFSHAQASSTLIP